ncbi:MAG: MATE family efflux transporter [Calditerrivibrio sp.]|nr:MATE family efflux transporter [Calditerrivibrio sp.]
MREVLKEIRSISYIAFPIMVAFISHLFMGFTDNVMAGRYSSIDLAAISIGSAIWMPLYLFFSAVLSAITPMMAMMIGEGEVKKQKDLLYTGRLLGVGIGFFLLFVVYGTSHIIPFITRDLSISEISKNYIFFVSSGMPALLLYQVYRSIFEAHGKTVPIMLSSFSGMLLNIPLNFIFIYGKLGMPAMGGAGCGIATSISSYFMLFILIIFYKKSIYLGKGKIDKNFAKRIVTLGLPIGASTFLEAFVFSFGSIVLAPFGAVTVASHQVALNFISTIFMIPMSLGIAISVRISQFYGKKDLIYTTFIWKTGIAFVEFIALFSSLFIYLFSDIILNLYTKDAGVLQLAKPLLIIAISFHVIDAFQVTVSNVMRGYHNTKFPMLVNIISYWIITLPLSYCLVYIFDLMAVGFWISLVAGIVSSAFILGINLLNKYNFRKM